MPDPRCLARGMVALLLAALLAAQDEPEGDAPGPGRQLTAAQIAEQLDRVKASVLPKVMGDKVAKDDELKKKWLAEWRAIPSPHYLVFSNGPVTCKKYAETLERLYAYVKKELPFEDVDHLLTAFIFASKEEYYRFAVQITGYSEEGARATAGHANGAYYATYYESPTAPIVFHEATHQLVSACLKVPGVGSWFQEGVAVYFATKTSGEKPAGAEERREARRLLPADRVLRHPRPAVGSEGQRPQQLRARRRPARLHDQHQGRAGGGQVQSVPRRGSSGARVRQGQGCVGGAHQQ